MKTRWIRSAVLLCAIASCGALNGQSAPRSEAIPPIDHGTPRHVSGHVIDDLTGKPLSGAKVVLTIFLFHSSCANCPFSSTPPAQPPPPRELVTAEDGSFIFDDVPPRMINVAASKDGYLTSWPLRRRAKDTLGNYQTASSIDSIVISLAPEATISGVLRHHDGSPVTLQPQIALEIVQAWAGFPRVEAGGYPKYSSDGSYRFGDLYPGCYSLFANPFREKEPVRTADEHVYGEVPIRYPVSSNSNPNPCFPLREGEHRIIDLTLPEKELHRVTATSAPVTGLPANIEDESGYYDFHELYSENKSEAWLPDGQYWLDNGRVGEISGPIPFTVKGADRLNLHFTIQPQYSTWMKVPIEVSAPPQQSAAEARNTTPCGFVNVSLVRFDRFGYVEVGDNPMFALGEKCGEQKPVALSMAPGMYTLAIDTTWLNYYVKSIQSGSFDLSDGPLQVRPGEAPGPLKIELAEAGRIKGSLQFEGKPAPAWVYTLPLDTAGKTDFRLFQPTFANDDGTFEIGGLAPGSYFVFASDVELNRSKAYFTTSAFWHAHSKKIDVVTGKTSQIELTSFDPPDEP